MKKPKKKNLVFFTMIVIVLCSCNQKKRQDNHKIINKKTIDLSIIKDLPNIKDIYNMAFYKVTQTDSIDIIFHYCDANVNTIKVYRDSIWEDFGQESYTMSYSVSKVINNKIIFLSNPNQRDFTFEILDIQKGYWEINNKIYIDSLKINTITHYEQPCIECWDEDDCAEMERRKKLEN